MDTCKLLHNQHKILSYLSHIPRKMVLLADRENVAEFVLHDLCRAECFNFNRAAYLIDNPDFNCLHGIAGFDRDTMHTDDCWSSPQEFSAHMKQCAFNKEVRALKQPSKVKAHDTSLDDVAQALGFGTYGVSNWKSKHDNHGIFLYEPATSEHCLSPEHILNGVSLFSFCPIF